MPHQLSLAVSTDTKNHGRNGGNSGKSIRMDDNEKADKRTSNNKCDYPCNHSEKHIFAASITYKDHDLLEAIGKNSIR